MNQMIVCFLTLGVFLGLAVVALREARHLPGYTDADRAEMNQLIDHVTTPHVVKIKPVALPKKRGMHWIALWKVAEQSPSEGFNDYLEMASKGVVK